MGNKHNPGCGCCGCEFFTNPGWSNWSQADDEVEVDGNYLKIFAGHASTTDAISDNSQYYTVNCIVYPVSGDDLDFTLSGGGIPDVRVKVDANQITIYRENCAPKYFYQPSPSLDACEAGSELENICKGVEIRLKRCRTTTSVIEEDPPEINRVVSVEVYLYTEAGVMLLPDFPVWYSSRWSAEALATLGDNSLTITNNHASADLHVRSASSEGDPAAIDEETEGPEAGECRVECDPPDECVLVCRCANEEYPWQVRVVASGFESSWVHNYVIENASFIWDNTITVTGLDALNGTYLYSILRDSFCCYTNNGFPRGSFFQSLTANVTIARAVTNKSTGVVTNSNFNNTFPASLESYGVLATGSMSQFYHGCQLIGCSLVLFSGTTLNNLTPTFAAPSRSGSPIPQATRKIVAYGLCDGDALTHTAASGWDNCAPTAATGYLIFPPGGVSVTIEPL